MDRLTSMAVFVKAVDLGSFAAAAAALDLSGPMVGKHIRFLEERLGVRHIHRTTRRQSLSDFGRAYYERCRVILAEAEASDALAADQLSEPRGKLRVTMPVHFGRHCIMPVLLELARQYPALKLDISFNDGLIDLADDGNGLAIRTGTLADRADLIARRVARQPMLSKSMAARRRWRIWRKTKAVVYRRCGSVPPWLFPQQGQTPFEVLPLNRFRLDDLDAIADAATSGAGLAWLPY